MRVAKTEQRAIGALFGYHALQRLHENRGLQNTSERHVRGVFGDGEMDEPESIGGLTLAAREGLDNLTFIINCNLQSSTGRYAATVKSVPSESFGRKFES